MSKQDQLFMRRLGKKLADIAYVKAIPQIPSTTLQAGLETFVDPVGGNSQKSGLFIPHYWAVFLHDGRKGINMPPGMYMVWYRDSSQDPRLVAGSSPVRRSQVRRLNLSPAEFRNLRRSGDIIVAQKVKATQATDFFENDGGMAGFVDEAADEVAVQFGDYVVTQRLKHLMNLKVST